MHCAFWKLSEFDGYLCSLRHLIVLLLFSVILYLKDIKYDQVCAKMIFMIAGPSCFTVYIIRILKVFPWYWNICRYYIFNIKNWCICTFKIVCETLIYHIISRYIYIKHCTLKKDVCLNFFKPHEFDLFLPILSIF